MNIFPQPKKISYSEGYNGKRNFKIIKNDFDDSHLEFIISKLGISDDGAPVTISCNKLYSKERYDLLLENGGVSIIASTPRGVYNAITTLIQIMRNEVVLCARIEDEPDFEDRSILMDMVIKVTKMEEMKKLIDLFGELKYNQIQINYDNLHFELKSFKKYCKWSEVVTVDYIKEINEYCKNHFIDLVPNHNSFGHMSAFLTLEDFNDFAECPEGFERTDEYGFTYHMPPGTLDPYDDRSIEFMDRLYGDLLPHFDSGKFNVCCDETFELGRGKSKPIADKYGRNKVYTDYMNKLHKLCNKYGKKMLFWADMIIDSPDALKDMPKDSVAITWGYEEEHPFAEQCKHLKESGLDFYVATGTSSWSDCIGRSDNALINQRDAAVEGKKYGAMGYFLTDWMDCMHPHHIVNYIPYAYSSGLAWNVDEHKDITKAYEYLDNNLFYCKGFSEFLFDCGNAYKLEAYKRFNTTAHWTALYSPVNDSYYLYDQTAEYFEAMIAYTEKNLEKLKEFNKCSSEFTDEIEFNLKTYITLAKICMLKLGDEVSKAEIISELKEEQEMSKNVWLRFNSEYGSDIFVTKTNDLISQL